MSESSSRREVTVKPGDCMASIAFESGLPWQTLWDSPENKALKDSRENPFTLLPGDAVVIPPLNLRFEDCPTDKKYKFVLKSSPFHLRLFVLDAEEKPFANQPYKLEIEKQTFTGLTDGKGGLTHLIPGDAREGRLLVGETEKHREYYLQLGRVPPIDTVHGAQARLFDLGYYDGDVDGTIDGQTRSSIVVFQSKHKLPVTGSYTQETQDKLKEIFGS